MKCKCVRQQGWLELCEPCRKEAWAKVIMKMKLGTDLLCHKKFDPFCRTCSNRALSKIDVKLLEKKPKKLKIMFEVEIEE